MNRRKDLAIRDHPIWVFKMMRKPVLNSFSTLRGFANAWVMADH